MFYDWITSTKGTNSTFTMSNCVPAKKECYTCFIRIFRIKYYITKKGEESPSKGGLGTFN